MTSPGKPGRLDFIAYLPTTAIKIAGLAIAVDQVLIKGDGKPLVILLAAFMMAGAQVSEGMVVAFMDRLFQPYPRPPEHDHGSPPADPERHSTGHTRPPGE